MLICRIQKEITGLLLKWYFATVIFGSGAFCPPKLGQKELRLTPVTAIYCIAVETLKQSRAVEILCRHLNVQSYGIIFTVRRF